MSNLILPDHLAKKISKPQSKSTALNSAYVDPKDVVLNPDKIEESVLKRMPQPTGWRILILPYKGAAVTKGGVLMADETIERNALSTVVAYVLAVGPDAYDNKDKFPAGPWCKKGDWVMIGRYAGARFKIEGGEVRIINDDEVIATIIDPSDVLSV